MDDFVLIHEDKEYLKYCLGEIKREVEKIGLELNGKTSMYPLSQGVKFMQWRFILTETGKVFTTMSQKKMGKERRRLDSLLKKEANGEIPVGTAENSFTSWKANAERGDAYYRVQRMKTFFEERKDFYGNRAGKNSENSARCNGGKGGGK